MTTYNKRTEVKHDTVKDFLSANKSYVLKVLKSTYWNKNIKINKVATDFFIYANNSEGLTDSLTSVIKKKFVKQTIDFAVKAFASKYDANFTENFKATNDFIEERKQDNYNTKSI